MPFKISYLKLLFLTVPLIAFFYGCGSGGGTRFFGGADFNVALTPREIDTGDRTLVEVDLSDVHPDGIVIKVRFPPELEYVEGSAVITIAGEELELEPYFLGPDDNEEIFLVFILEDEFGFEEEGALAFELRGVDELEDGEVEVDVDIDDGDGFDLDQPEFSPEASEIIQVGDSD